MTSTMLSQNNPLESRFMRYKLLVSHEDIFYCVLTIWRADKGRWRADKGRQIRC